MGNICLACPNLKHIDANFVDNEPNFQVNFNLNQQSFDHSTKKMWTYPPKL